MAAPVERDQELELTVESLAYGGNGVARLNGFVVFVRRGLPGDVVRARVTKVKRNHAEALVTEVLQPGPNRVEAPCRHYYEGCGGRPLPAPALRGGAGGRQRDEARGASAGGGGRGGPGAALGA